MVKVGDRVRWAWPEKDAEESELNGKVTKIYDNGEISVKFDDGSEDICQLSDLQVTGETHR